jgi:hypothetical protein
MAIRTIDSSLLAQQNEGKLHKNVYTVSSERLRTRFPGLVPLYSKTMVPSSLFLDRQPNQTSPQTPRNAQSLMAFPNTALTPPLSPSSPLSST